MERRYTALAEDQGKLAAEKEKLLAENGKLVQVMQCDEADQMASILVTIVYAHWLVFPRTSKQQEQKTTNCRLSSLKGMLPYRERMLRCVVYDFLLLIDPKLARNQLCPREDVDKAGN